MLQRFTFKAGQIEKAKSQVVANQYKLVFTLFPVSVGHNGLGQKAHFNLISRCGLQQVPLQRQSVGL